jgi:hypothetical protein
MVTLQADDTRLLKDLRLFIEPVEVYSTDGKLLGLFVPANLERGKQIMAQAKASFDPAELKRRMEYKGPLNSFSELVQGMKALQNEHLRRQAAGERDFTFEEAQAFLEAHKKQVAEPAH